MSFIILLRYFNGPGEIKGWVYRGGGGGGLQYLNFRTFRRPCNSVTVYICYSDHEMTIHQSEEHQSILYFQNTLNSKEKAVIHIGNYHARRETEFYESGFFLEGALRRKLSSFLLSPLFTFKERS